MCDVFGKAGRYSRVTLVFFTGTNGMEQKIKKYEFTGTHGMVQTI